MIMRIILSAAMVLLGSITGALAADPAYPIITLVPQANTSGLTVNGQCLTTSAGLFCRIAGSVVGPFGTGTGGGSVSSVTAATPNGTLTLGGTNPVTSSGTINFDLNLGHANTWSAVQTFVTPMLGAASATSVALTGGTVTNVPTPSAGTDAANKTYVDNVASALNPAVAVQAATTQASDTSGFTYSNGASGIGATLTGPVNTAFAPDGFTFTATGQRALIKNDTVSVSGSHNGVYQVTQLQTGILPVILTRTLDYDQPSDMNNTGSIPVVNGTLNAQTTWLLTSSIATVGTDPLTFTQFSLNPSTTVVGPGSATDGHFAIYSGSTGKLLKDTLSAPGTAATQNTGTSGATIPLLNGTNVWSAQQSASVTTLSISTATFTPDGTNNNYSITLVHASCPCTLANPSATPVAGTSGQVVVKQSSTGSDTIGTYGSQFQAPGGTSTITLSTGANAVDVLSYYVMDSTHILLSPSLNYVH